MSRLAQLSRDDPAARSPATPLSLSPVDFDRALEQVEVRVQVPVRDDRRPEFHNNRGAARHARGDLGGAADDFDRALELNPDYPEAYNNRGTLRHARGDLGGALQDFNRALELNPHYAEAYNNRGTLRHACGDLRGAIRDFDRALELLPRHQAAPVYHNRGAARRGDFDAAIADFDQALELDPSDCVAYISRGNARFHKRDRKCRDDYRAAFALDARLAASEIIRLLDDGLRHDLAEVLANCEKHLRIDPADVVALARRGLTLLLQGKQPEADTDLQQIQHLDPSWGSALQLLTAEAKRRARSFNLPRKDLHP
jgi:tetratricopeptide (TPR) repeat protein